ncbi:globin family protein [Sulfitobacter sp. D35]|uniref:globin family protein n=1 Tax=Sulfitobacter sp. D35 TaxID=3083252 RepID=UPI00296F51D5|nr:globin family protein [Sulfitobacter sp. D35]MDW4499446.1 globin family protein [Sulfitobacter sp. D35]
MQTSDVALIQQSFMKVMPMKMHLAQRFYEKLFETCPGVRSLFPAEMTGQGEKLMLTLATLIRGLTTPEKVIPLAEDLARRHRSYGTEAAHYAVVGETLIETLREALGDEFTPEVEAAWCRIYETLSQVMIAAAEAAQPAVPRARGAA